MKLIVLPTVLITLFLAGCATKRNLDARLSHIKDLNLPPTEYAKPIPANELAAALAAPPLKARALTMRFRWDRDALPAVTTKPGKRAVAEVIREFKFPVDFDFPAFSSPPLTPTTPRGFDTQITGLKIEFIAELRGAFVVVRGIASERICEGFIRNSGDPFRPITGARGKLLSANWVGSPMFTTRETRFVVALRPGRSETIAVNSEMRKTRLELACEIVR